MRPLTNRPGIFRVEYTVSGAATLRVGMHRPVHGERSVVNQWTICDLLHMTAPPTT